MSAENVIKFGSIIYIAGIDKYSNPSVLKDAAIISDGFVDQNLYLAEAKNAPNMSFSRALFILMPSFNNDAKVSLLPCPASVS
jgi:hypothetical protein